VLMNPGALAEGRYGILEVNDGKVTKAEIHNLSE
ncbi:MAG: serine/threonine protein phosphatase, partial [Treponema sp.]|nr:serine/threonine protein phosphatase [Treponema sp.]